MSKLKNRELAQKLLVAVMLAGLMVSNAVSANGALRFETLASEDGLSENTVKAIVEDKQGFLWFGTEHGLNRFDGLEFKIFTAGSDPARELTESHINVLFVDRDGMIWVGTFGGGISRYDPKSGAFRNYLHDTGNPRSLSNDDISAIWQDRSGLIWVGTYGGGINRLDPRTNTIVPIALSANPRNAAANQISSIVGDGARGLWVGTLGAGLFHVEAGAVSANASGAIDLRLGAEAAIGKDVTALLLDADKTLWVGTRRDGLAQRLPDGTFRIHRHDAGNIDSLAHDTVNRLYEDRQKRLWVATARGLDLFDPPRGSFSHNQHDPSDKSTLPYNDVFAVQQDSLGTLWVGTGGGGVARHTPPGRQFTIIEHDPTDSRGTSSGGVWSVFEDANGSLWVGTLDGGLQLAPPGSDQFSSYRQHSDARDSLSDNDVRAIVEEDANRLWIGTRRGLNLLDRSNGKVRQFLHDATRPGSLGHDYVRPLLKDAGGTLWVGTYGGGLDRYLRERDAFAHYRHDPARADSLSDDRVYCLLSDTDGALWVGTHGGGLNRLDPSTGKFSRYQHDPRDSHSLSNNRVLALQQDRSGRIWIGTGAGLDRFEPSTGRFVHHEGLRQNLVYAIAEDGAGRLWMSTNDGMVRLDPASGQLRRFPMQEIWGNSEFNGGVWHRGRSGHIYFGGVSGVVKVAPDSTAEQRDVALPMLTDFSLFNRSVRSAALDPASPLKQPIEFARHIELTHEDSVFGFAFAALRAIHPERRLFSYRLDGFDDRWLETRSGQRDATYTGVPAGNYTFRVRTTDADGVWLPNQATVQLRILPAPWRSAGAYAAYVVAAAALIAYWAWQRHRRRAIKRQAQLALKKSEQRLSLALWGSGDEMLDWDLETGTMLRIGGESGRETHVTEGLASIDALAPRVHPDDFPALRVALSEHFSGTSDHLEVSYRALTRSGEWLWKLVRARVVARDAAGRPLRFSGTQKDISRIKAVESELRELNEALDERVRQRTQELEERQAELVEAEKMASLGRLVAGVAHEVNTPLGVSVTAISFLRDQVAAVKSALLRFVGADEAERIVAPIEQAGAMTETNLKRAASLVKTFKQVAVDQHNHEFRTILVREYLESSLVSLQPRLKMFGHQVDLSGDPTIEMTGRPDVLYQIIVNLVMNSILHAFPDVPEGRIAISIERLGTMLQLTYSDNGVGMSPDIASRIFEPFFTTRRGSGGTGLGMHIVYNLVTQALAGRINCSTAPGQGVRFIIEFPQVHPRSG
jgi:ligand-binding sensor domain-containing protein/signal transduction histidine kinase